MDDKQIIELYFRRDEQAIRESMEAYDAYCHSIAVGILSDPADAEEAVADILQEESGSRFAGSLILLNTSYVMVTKVTRVRLWTVPLWKVTPTECWKV